MKCRNVNVKGSCPATCQHSNMHFNKELKKLNISLIREIKNNTTETTIGAHCSALSFSLPISPSIHLVLYDDNKQVFFQTKSYRLINK